MEEVLVFQHDPFEDLGFFGEVLDKQGTDYRVVRLFHGEMPTEEWEHVRALIILGGPMNVDDEEAVSFLRWEKRIIRAAIDESVPMLGICLGAQLLAHVLGAPVQRHSQAEMGWYDVHMSADGRSDPVLGAAGERLPVFQWHSYSYDLPSGATHLARTETCEQQAFRFGSNAYGFQFHLEADVGVIERWLALPAFRAELAAAGLPADEQAIRAETEKLVAATRSSADAVFNNFLDLIGRPGRRLPLPSRGMPAWTE